MHRYSVIAHEYFHTYQMTQNKHANKYDNHPTSFKTKWLIEGSAASFESIYIDSKDSTVEIKGDGTLMTTIDNSGINVTGNATGLSGTPNVSVGNLTGTSAVVGSAVTVNSTGVDAGAGIVTATKFSGNTAQGGGNDSVFQMNGMTVTQDFEFPDGQSAMSVGPITINSGVEVTVPDGQNWVIL